MGCITVLAIRERHCAQGLALNHLCLMDLKKKKRKVFGREKKQRKQTQIDEPLRKKRVQECKTTVVIPMAAITILPHVSQSVKLNP